MGILARTHRATGRIEKKYNCRVIQHKSKKNKKKPKKHHTSNLPRVISCSPSSSVREPCSEGLAWGLNGLAQSLAYPLHVKLLDPWFRATERGTAMVGGV